MANEEPLKYWEAALVGAYTGFLLAITVGALESAINFLSESWQVDLLEVHRLAALPAGALVGLAVRFAIARLLVIRRRPLSRAQGQATGLLTGAVCGSPLLVAGLEYGTTAVINALPYVGAATLVGWAVTWAPRPKKPRTTSDDGESLGDRAAGQGTNNP